MMQCTEEDHKSLENSSIISTSRFTKGLSSDPLSRENRVVNKMILANIEFNKQISTKNHQELTKSTIEGLQQNNAGFATCPIIKNRKLSNDEEMKMNAPPLEDEQSWAELIKRNKFEELPPEEVSKKVRRGIPNEMRPAIWEFLTDTSKSQKKLYAEGLYKKLSATDCNCERWIKTDTTRTFSSNAFFSEEKNQGEEKLDRILRAFANLDAGIGYTQGMNFIAAALLLIMNPENYLLNPELDILEMTKYFEKYTEEYEEKAFWIFVHIMHEKDWRSAFKLGTPKVIEMSKQLQKALETEAPEVLEKITKLKLDVHFLFSEMFLTLLFLNAPFDVTKRVLDIFIIEGEKIIFEVIIRALNLSKAKILNIHDEEDLNVYIRKRMFNELYENDPKLLNLFPLASE